MITRVFDYRRVKRLAPWPLVISSEVVYLIESSGGEDVGLWAFEKFLDGFKIHAEMGFKCRGKKVIASANAAFKWIFDSFDMDNIYAEIPAKNKPACLVASRSGMQFINSQNDFRRYQLRRHHG